MCTIEGHGDDGGDDDDDDECTWIFHMQLAALCEQATLFLHFMPVS